MHITLTEQDYEELMRVKREYEELKRRINFLESQIINMSASTLVQKSDLMNIYNLIFGELEELLK
jgi:hypothetical protein